MIQFKALEFHICKPERKQFKIFSQKSHKNDYRKKIRHFLLHVSAIVHMWSVQEPAFHCLFCSIYFFDKMTRLQKSIYFIQISVKTNTLECLTVRIIVSLVTHTHFRCSESRKNDLFITLITGLHAFEATKNNKNGELFKLWRFFILNFG